MFIQGDLQKVFDALYHMGIIDQVLKMDWTGEYERLEKEPTILKPILSTVNTNDGAYEELIMDLSQYDDKSLSYLAMLVAKELMEYHTNPVVH